jgi:hypothetical protein
MIRIVNNKKVEMTNDEFAEFKAICLNYERKNYKGEEIFSGKFETNDDGMIVFIKSYHGNTPMSFEGMFFLMNLSQNQWLRAMTTLINDNINRNEALLNEKIQELDMKLAQLENK